MKKKQDEISSRLFEHVFEHLMKCFKENEKRRSILMKKRIEEKNRLKVVS